MRHLTGLNSSLLAANSGPPNAVPAGTGALSSHRIRSLCGLTAFEPPIRIHMKLVLRLIGEAVGSADLFTCTGLGSIRLPHLGRPSPLCLCVLTGTLDGLHLF